MLLNYKPFGTSNRLGSKIEVHGEMKKIEELLTILKSISKIADSKKKEYEDEMEQFRFNINECSFAVYCIYGTVTVNVWERNNFHIFVFIFSDDGESDGKNVKEAEKLFNSIRLPPDLIIGELNKIGVSEL